VVPKPPPAPLAYAAKPKPRPRRNGVVKRATTKAAEIAKKPVTGGQIGAAVGGALSYTGTAAVIVGRGWLSPIWTSAILTTAGAGATYAAYTRDMPHATAFAAGWTLGGVAQGATSAIVHLVSDEDEAKDKGKPRNALGDGSETEDIAHRLRLTEERARELDRELARARERLNPEMELAA
jgi:hypothetical protein